MNPILLFDIDGTLLHVKKGFLLDVIHQILIEFDLTHLSLKNRSFAGRTDRDIFTELVDGLPDSEYLFTEVSGMYKKMMANHLSRFDVVMIPGAVDTVGYAIDNRLEAGLCTGNFREVAYAKTNAIGMPDTFRFGGFGCHHHDRNYLPELARQDYETRLNRKADPDQFIVIGDTPNDIRSAQYFGARSVAVTTGSFDKEQLLDYRPDIIVDNLYPPEDWVQVP